MHIEKHYERLHESLEVLDESITKNIVKRQRTIGFHCSIAAADMLEIFLHLHNLIDPGLVVKHEWLKSKNKMREKFHFDFQHKRAVLSIMEHIEEKRNELCYGSPQTEESIRDVILHFNRLKQLFGEMGVAIEK